MSSLFASHLGNADYLTGTVSNISMNASGVVIGMTFNPLPKQITDIGVNINSITGAQPTYIAQLEGISANNPSGSLIAAGASKTFVPGGAGWLWNTLTTPYTPSNSDIATGLAACIRYSSGTIDGTHFAAMLYRFGSGQFVCPCPQTNNGTTWTQNTSTFPSVAVRYSDNTVHPLCAAITSVTDTDFNNTSGTKEYANQFTCSGAFSLYGSSIYTKLAANSTVQFTLYAADGTTVLTTNAQAQLSFATAGAWPSSGSVGLGRINFSDYQMADGTVYYAAISPGTANNMRVRKITFADADSKRAFYGGHNDPTFVSRAAIGSGAFGSSDANSVIAIDLMVDGITAAAAGLNRAALQSGVSSVG